MSGVSSRVLPPPRRSQFNLAFSLGILFSSGDRRRSITLANSSRFFNGRVVASIPVACQLLGPMGRFDERLRMRAPIPTYGPQWRMP